MQSLRTMVQRDLFAKKAIRLHFTTLIYRLVTLSIEKPIKPVEKRSSSQTSAIQSLPMAQQISVTGILCTKNKTSSKLIKPTERPYKHFGVFVTSTLNLALNWHIGAKLHLFATELNKKNLETPRTAIGVTNNLQRSPFLFTRSLNMRGISLIIPLSLLSFPI